MLREVGGAILSRLQQTGRVLNSAIVISFARLGSKGHGLFVFRQNIELRINDTKFGSDPPTAW